MNACLNLITSDFFFSAVFVCYFQLLSVLNRNYFLFFFSLKKFNAFFQFLFFLPSENEFVQDKQTNYKQKSNDKHNNKTI